VNAGVQGTSSAGGHAVLGLASGTGDGGFFQSSGQSSAVTGRATGAGRAGAFISEAQNTANPAVQITSRSQQQNHSALVVNSAGSGAFAAGNFDSNGGIAVYANGGSRGVYARATGSGGLPLIAEAYGQQTPTNIALFNAGGFPRARIDSTDKGFFNGGTQTGGADVAEAMRVEGPVSQYAPGHVLVISTRSDERLELSSQPYSTLVVGVYALRPGILLTERHIDADMSDTVPLGVIGVIPTKVSVENGPIRRGDLLVTSGTPGHAMRGTLRNRMLGATIGKALENFSGPGTGVIRVLVSVR
jgi:hypothetical protein